MLSIGINRYHFTDIEGMPRGAVVNDDPAVQELIEFPKLFKKSLMLFKRLSVWMSHKQITQVYTL